MKKFIINIFVYSFIFCSINNSAYAEAEFKNYREYLAYIFKHNNSEDKDAKHMIGPCAMIYSGWGYGLPCFNVKGFLSCLNEFQINNITYNGENILTEKYIESKKLCQTVEEVTPKFYDMGDYSKYLWNSTVSKGQVVLGQLLFECMIDNSDDKYSVCKLSCNNVPSLISCMNKDPESKKITHKGILIVTEDYIKNNHLCY